MKAAILGAGGQLGRALTALLPDAVACTAPTSTSPTPRRSPRTTGPASTCCSTPPPTPPSTAAETPEGRVAAWAANATAVAHLAAAANAHDMTLVHVSSEYVFDGTTAGPILEDG